MAPGRARVATAVAAVPLGALGLLLCAVDLPLWRAGHLYSVRHQGDGDQLRGAFLVWVPAVLVCWSAAALSLAPWAGPGGPAPVRAARWVLVAAPVLVAAVAVHAALLGEGCWRSCAPFPR